MRKILIGLALFLFLSVSLFVSYVIGFNDGLKSSSSPAYTQEQLKKVRLDSDKLWSLVQKWRESEGLQSYIKDQRLCDVAKKRAPEIKNELDSPHEGFKESIVNFPNTMEFAENNVGALSEEEALNQWLNSKEHAETLRHSYKYSCIATDGYHAVQIFSNL